ncbi:MAG: OmpA family protein [Nitrospira sp.]
MSLQVRHRYEMFVLWFIVLTMILSCSGRRVSSGMDDQTSRSHAAPAPIGTAKIDPPVRVEEPEIRPSEPAAVEPPPIPASPPIPRLLELTDVYFDFDQYAIRSDARTTLKASASILKAQSNHTIVVEGHCDERGTNAYNLVLGERRAKAVKRHLQDLGLSASQVQIASYGKELTCLAPQHSEACRQLNRRVHFSWP